MLLATDCSSKKSEVLTVILFLSRFGHISNYFNDQKSKHTRSKKYTFIQLTLNNFRFSIDYLIDRAFLHFRNRKPETKKQIYVDCSNYLKHRALLLCELKSKGSNPKNIYLCMKYPSICFIPPSPFSLSLSHSCQNLCPGD